MKRFASAILGLGFLIAILAFPTFAQISGSMRGSVRDSSGASVPQATLTLTNKDTNVTQQIESNDVGDYLFPIVPVGNYRLSVEKTGFESSNVSDIVVALGQATRVDTVLRVAAALTTVEVKGQVSTLQTESGEVRGLVAHRDIVDLPLNGRNFIQLVALQPHAVPAPHTSFFRNLGGYNVIAGAPVSGESVTIDGVNIKDINDPRINISLTPDAIQEFQEQQSNYSAGKGMGSGAQVNLVTKSGTNTFHGSLFEFLRNEKLDAKNFFATKKPAYRQNQFGGSLGGPIIKNKTFFFGAYEGLRIVQSESFLYTVPTEAQRGGNFTGSPPIFDPSNVDPTTGLRRPFPGNMIPPNKISPVATKALQLLFPLPNLPGSVNNLASIAPNNSTNDQWIARIDHTIGPRDTLWGRFISYDYRRVTSIFAALPNFSDNFNTPSKNLAMGYVHTFSGRAVNQFRLGYHRMTQLLQDVDIKVPINQQIGITGTSTLFLGNPTISIAGLSRTGAIGNAPNNRSDNGYYLYDDFAFQRGNHSMSVGFSLAKEEVNGGYNPNVRGSFSYQPRYTAQIGVPSTGSAVADFVLGFPSSSVRGLGVGFRNLRQDRWGAYYHDDWKINSQLFVNLGIRWEYYQPGYEKRNRLSAFDRATGKIVIAGQNGVSRSFRESRYKDFQPRIGIAYHIPGHKTVLRGGYGLFFSPLNMNMTPLGHLVNEPFFTLESFFGDPVTPTLTLANAFPTGLGVPSLSLETVQKDMDDGRLQTWNFTIEQELAPSLIMEVGYLGNRGTNLYTSGNINAPTAGPGSLVSKRPFPAFSTITEISSAARSRYDSLFVRATKQFRGGLSFNFSYTWSKLLSTGGIQDRGDQGVALRRNPLDLNAEYGRDIFDAQHRFVGSYVWVLPVGKGKRFGRDWSGPLQQALGDWQVNGIIVLQSGLPITPRLAFDNSNTGNGLDRPDVAKNPNNGPRTVEKWFDISAFVLPARYSYGNAGRNIIDGPPIKTVDLSLIKLFTLTERVQLQFRVEFFNLFNHPNFDPPSTTFGTGTFGVISGAADPRQVQFGLRIVF
ncbi:MAG TPA: TonB-dependent receptor [Candidatus Dormibacteraeota bacterium]|nr:TonB-dependent receptor [Candidatus Dormibacteraeota bacterium]